MYDVAGVSENSSAVSAEKFGLVEENCVIFHKSTNTELGHVEYILGTSLSLKAVCHCHREAPAPAAEGKRRRGKANACYLLVSAHTEFWPRYERCLEGLVSGNDLGHAAHLESASEIAQSLKRPK